MSEKSEHWEQSHFVSWFRQTFSQDDVRIFAIPNGGSRGLREGVKFKAEGVSAGVPDLFSSLSRYLVVSGCSSSSLCW